MGFWSSLVEGAKSAGGWILDHSGDIASAVGTVAKIAGTIALAEDSGEPDDQTHLEEFHTNFKIACHKLQKAAKGETQKLVAEANRNLKAEEFSDKDAVFDSFTGVWQNPTALLPDGTPAVPMYQDLSKWLSTLGMPPDQSVDVASSVAQALFVNTEKASTNNGGGTTPPNDGGDDGIQVTSFPYTDHTGQWTLDTAHAYYPIGLGTGVQGKCWHSCIYARYHPSKTQKLASKAQPRRAFVSKIDADEPVWVVNANVNWGNASVAAGVHQKLINKLGKDFKKQNRKVISSSTNGVSQSVQVQGDATDNPSLLCQSLISAASKVVSEYTRDQDIPDPHPDYPDSGDETDTDSDDDDTEPDTDTDDDDDNEAHHLDDGTDCVDDFDTVTVKKNKQEKKDKKKKQEKTCSKAKTGSVRAATKDGGNEFSSVMPMNVPEVTITQSQIVYLSAAKK